MRRIGVFAAWAMLGTACSLEVSEDARPERAGVDPVRSGAWRAGEGAGADEGGEPFRVAPPLEGDGAHQVRERAVAIPAAEEALEATVYQPASGPGPWPLVVLLPGYGSQHAHYAVFARHLASWGLATVGVDTSDQADHERSAREVSAVLDWAASGPLAAQLDASRIAVAGHSLGGKIAFFAAAIDPRVRAVIAWDPVDAGGPPCWLAPRDCHRWSVAPNSFPGDTGMMQQLRAASLIFSAPVGWANPREHHAERFWEGAPAPALWVHFPHGEHGRWPHGVPEQRISRRTQVAWLMHHLLGLPGMESYVTGEFMEEDVRRGLVTVAMRPAGPVFCAAPPAAG